MNARIIFVILITAALLRVVSLSAGDTLSDEVGYAFRAIGMLDFDEAEQQTTPLEWFDPFIPSWTKLSFHDHPPLVFFVQHVFMDIFGETNFGFRFPSALLGIACVYLLYRMCSLLYSTRAGLFAALVLAVTVNHVFVSRLGLQEVYVIFFILLAMYLFLKSLKNDTYFIWTGIALGLGMLAKYTAIVVAPICLAYLAIHKPQQFCNKKLWAGAVFALLILSPVLIYNYKLYQAVGHFDFQLSFIFGQHPKAWSVMPGKEIGSLMDRVKSFIPNLISTHSWVVLILFGTSVTTFLYTLTRHPRVTITRHLFLIISFFFLTILVAGIGPSTRFLTLFGPFIALSVGVFLEGVRARWFQKRPRMGTALLGLFIAFEIFYSWNSVVASYPIGTAPWTYSVVRNENYNWGYNELAEYLTRELAGKRPAFAFESTYTFLEDIHTAAIEQQQKEQNLPYGALVVYDKNILNVPQLWVLDRLQIYHAWPVIPVETYAETLRANGADYFKKAGIEKTYYIAPTDHVPTEPKAHLRSTLGFSFEQELRARNIAPLIIKNKRGDDVFRVYTF